MSAAGRAMPGGRRKKRGLDGQRQKKRSRQAVAARFAASCAVYNNTPSCRRPSSSPPTQPMTKPGPEQQPSRSSLRASRRLMRCAPYSRPASCADTAYPPSQDSATACAASGASSPSSRCRGRSSRQARGSRQQLAHHKKGNSAGSTLARQSAVPEAKPSAAASGAASSSMPSTPLLPPPRAVGFCSCSYCAPHCVYLGNSFARGGNSHETEKPHPRKHHGRPDLRRMLAPPPQGFTAYRRWSCGAAAC